ncbi:hypothetical protein LCGC14_0633890 [marine sediment metagenome]|uniref:Aminotransferase class V domain-containing protein n=1 Tax=marine sediment metagenome TaxID=412755 RepID=A0A0F9U9N1_9ZZZZ|nr:MAG: Kynureninase [Candidatus Lokiarchaeum sp. GC14_75]
MEINWKEIREKEFPALNDVVHLKAAGGSPISRSAFKVGLSYLEDMLNSGDIFWDDYFKELELIRNKLSKYFNSKPSEIAFLINTSSCMNAVARMFNQGEIMYPEGEFPSSIHIFKRLGFTCKKINSIKHRYRIDDIKNRISVNTNYCIHSHVQYLTGFKQNLEKLGIICKENKIINIINATQSFGAFPINVKSQNIDVLVGSALKWACCGYGIGIIYIREELVKENSLPFSSWLSVKDGDSMDNDNLKIVNETKSMDSFGGTPHFQSLLTLKGGLTLIETIGDGNLQEGIKRISDRIVILTSEFVEKVKSLHYRIISPLELENRSGIITLEHKKAGKIYNELLKNHIYISLRNYSKSTEKTLLRFSFNYYNNFEDIEKAISILKKY